MLDPSSAQVADVILLVWRTLAAPGNGILANKRRCSGGPSTIPWKLMLFWSLETS